MIQKTIWKFPLEIRDRQIIQMPSGAQILSTQIDCGLICLWALVDPKAALQARGIKIFGTGYPTGDNPGVFLGTVQTADFVWHLFEDRDADHPGLGRERD